MLIIGIDPGISGSICFFQDGVIHDVIEMPTMIDGKKNTIEVKSDIIEHLWKIIISDNTIDQYESNLMRRICGLIYFPDKMCAEIKLRLLNNK